jgi:hypothetical protein
MTKSLSYDDYYSQQMDFIDSFIKSEFESEEKEKRYLNILKQQKEQTICFLDEFLNIEKGHELDTTRLGYLPLKDTTYKNKKKFLAPEATDINPKNRRLSRYRLIYGPVDFYLNSQFDKPTIIPLITACAPNLMGTSQADLDEFTDGNEQKNRTLKIEEYQKECNKIADFIVSEAKNAGYERLIMPEFGVGVYIKTLSAESQKTAKKLMYQAFATAAKTHEIQIDWIIWSQQSYTEAKKELLKSYSENNTYIKPVIADDILSHAQNMQEQGINCITLNAGSDRTVCGKYTTKHPTTIEEQIAQQSDLAFLHTNLNDEMVNTFNSEFKKRKEKHLNNNNIENSLDIKNISLFTKNRTTKNHKPCFEITCKTELQAKRIEQELRKENITHYETVIVKNIYRVKVEPTDTVINHFTKLGITSTDNKHTQVKTKDISKFNKTKNSLRNIKTTKDGSLKDIMIQTVEAYIIARKKLKTESNSSYKWTFFCLFGLGYSAKDKLDAADTFLKALKGDKVSDLEKHLGALRNGVLGNSIRGLIKNNDTKPLIGKNVNTVSEFVALLASNIGDNKTYKK